MKASEATSLLLQVEALCATHPHVPKIILVSRHQLGHALADAAARRMGGWAGLSWLTPAKYAAQIARLKIEHGRTALTTEGRVFLAARLLEPLEREGQVQGLPAGHRLASALSDAIEMLRLGRVSCDVLEMHVAESMGEPALQAVSTLYGAYLDELARGRLYDEADVYRWATQCVRKGVTSPADNAVIAITNDLPLSNSSNEFVQALRANSHAFYRLGVDASGPTPVRTAAARLSTVGVPTLRNGKEGSPGGKASEHRFCRAVGAANEVKAMLHDIIAHGVALDDVEIAYTSGNPYLSLIADQAERMEVPVSLGTGLPVRLTRVGQSLRSFYEWSTEDFNAAILIRMLRSGLLRIDRLLSAHEGSDVALAAHEAATLLASQSYEPGREGLRKGLRRAVREREERIRTLAARNLDAEHERQTLARWRALRHVVETLLRLVPRETTVREMAGYSKQFVERFGPIEKPSEHTPEEARTVDESARNILREELAKLMDLPFAYEASEARLTALFQGWLDSQYVHASHPRPGDAHVLPLESAGYGGRSHLYVVGLDSDSVSTPPRGDAMLRDADRRALSDSLEGTLPERGDASQERQWRVQQAVQRHVGPISLYTRIYDVESGEERYPSSLFLQLEREHADRDASDSSRDERVVGFLPDPEVDLIVSDSEAWLAAYQARRLQSEAPTGTAREALQDTYSWMMDGEAARRALQSDAYTEYDGLLAEDTYPSLSFFDDAYDGLLSAGRLETLAETPYLYFLKYVLGVRALDEPALDDESWFNRRRRGNLLHATFEAFMRSLDGEPPTLDHEPHLREILDAELEREVQRIAPSSPAVEAAARRQLRADALLFLRAEVVHAAEHDALHHEIGFGFGPYRSQDGDLGSASLPVDGVTLPFRGRIDRVDRCSDGTLAIWDYKTGSTSSFDASDPLQDGATLQWALYAYALEELNGEVVSTSGYFFTSAAEMGTRLHFSPSQYRDEVEALLTDLANMARTGSFPMNPNAAQIGQWTWDGYQPLFHNLKARSAQLKAKAYPSDRPKPPWLDD